MINTEPTLEDRYEQCRTERDFLSNYLQQLSQLEFQDAEEARQQIRACLDQYEKLRSSIFISQQKTTKSEV